MIDVNGEFRRPSPERMEFHVPGEERYFVWRAFGTSGKGAVQIDVHVPGHPAWFAVDRHGATDAPTDPNADPNTRRLRDFTEANFRRAVKEYLESHR